MRILMINKFLHPNGGSETYMFRLGECLEKFGHEVQYFGMEHEERCVGNAVNAYTSNMDFHNGSKLSKLTYPIKTIYSFEARKKLRLVLEDFAPDVCHINNLNYQLTPSIIVELQKWREAGHLCRIIYTAHDYQLICPNHMCRNPVTEELCEKCLGKHFSHCIRGKCIHGSMLKSIIGAAEAGFWNAKQIYRHLDVIICCSRFMKDKIDTNPILAGKTLVMHNFVERKRRTGTEKKDYVLYFGRFSKEKGVHSLIEVCKELPDIPFIFAGTGSLEEELEGVKNIHNAGFLHGEELEKLIREARFSVIPSEWYENCPFSVMESQMCGTPVLGADIGGIPELIRDGQTGELFPAGNMKELKRSIQKLWNDHQGTEVYRRNCAKIQYDTVDDYVEKLMKIYKG